MATSLLLLAGTTEAAELAHHLARHRPDVAVLASFAGRVREHAELPCEVRVGGFGGVDGLVDHLQSHPHQLLVDATHPFAAVMPHHAAEAAARAGVDHLRLLRPPWEPGDGDDWHAVDDLAEAADALATLGVRRAFLATGRHDLAPFAALDDVELVVRSIDPPTTPLPPGTEVALGRGPFDLDAELSLLRHHRIDAVVARNSGGTATRAKLDAARTLGLPVVLLRRPPGPAKATAATAPDAITWIETQLR